MNRAELVAHLLGEGHDVLAYGPTCHPNDLDVAALIRWHEASHQGDDVLAYGTCSEDGHVHRVTS